MMGPIKVGDRFYRVRRIGRTMHRDWVIVTKIGRKWAGFRTENGLVGRRGSEDRFDMETLRLDGGNYSSPGAVYRTAEEYESRVRILKLWKELRQRIDRLWDIPEGITEIDILKAADALKIKLREE